MKKLIAACLISLSLSTPAFANNYIRIDHDIFNQKKIIQNIYENNETNKSIVTPGAEEIIIELINKNEAFQLLPIQEFRETIDLGIKTLQTARTINMEKFQLALGFFLMFAICIFRAFWTTLPRRALPWLTMTIATVSSAMIGFLIGTPGDKIFIDAIMISSSAGGLWSLIGKHICRL